MKKNINKKILALFCALSVALTSITFPFSSKADGDSENKFKHSEYKDWQQVTFSDFGINDDTYNDIQEEESIWLGTYSESLEGKVFSGNVTFSSATTWSWFGKIYLGCEDYTNAENGTNYLYMKIGDTRYELTPENTGTTALLDTEFNLKLSYDLEESNGAKSLKLGVWINDRLYNNQYIEITDSNIYEGCLEGTIKYMTPVEGAYLTLGSASMSTSFVDSAYKNWEQLTFRDFGISDGTYNEIQEDDSITLGTYSESLEGKVFSGNVTFSSATSWSWFGKIYLGCEDYTNAENGTNYLYMKIGDTRYELTPENTGTAALLDAEFNLKLSYDVEESNGAKTLKLGVWINNNLYNNEFIEITDSDVYTGCLQGSIKYMTPVEGAYLSLHSVTAKTLFTDSKYADWEQVTFSDYGIEDDTYNEKDDFYDDGLANKVFNGNVKFSSGYGYILIGDYNAESGLLLYSDEGQLALKVSGNNYVMDPEIAGTQLIGNEFNLKLSYDLLDSNGDEEDDTLKLGVWINDRLYNNGYIETQNYSLLLSSWMSIVGSDNGAITVGSAQKEGAPPVSFTDSKYVDWEQITFSHYGLDNTIYDTVNGEDFSQTGYYEGSLEGKVFNGNVTFSNGINYLNIGGINDPWYGIYLISGYTDDMTVLHLKVAGEEYVITPKATGTGQTTLLEKEFNLKLSYDLADSNDDNVKDTLKLGVWINNLLYRYIDVTQYTEYLGGNLGIFTPTEYSAVTLRSEEIKKDDAVYFLDTEYKNWEQITFNDFGVPDDTYGAERHNAQYGTPPLDGKVFNGNVTFSEDSTCQIIIGGATDFDAGIYLYSYGDGQLRLNKNLGEIPTNIVRAGEKFNYKLSYDIVTGTEGTKYLKLGIWFNDVLYTYYETEDYAELVGPNISIVQGDGTTVTIESIQKLEPTIRFEDSKYADWEQITFNDFGIADDTYGAERHNAQYLYPPLDGKVFNGNVTFSKDSTCQIIIGGVTDFDNGLYLFSYGDGQLRLNKNLGAIPTNIVKAGKPFNYKLSYDIATSPEGTKSLKLGIWFNDVLYKYYETDNYEELVGPNISIVQGDGSTVTIESVGTKVLSTKLKRITFTDFGIADGTYTYAGDLATSGIYAGSLNNVVIAGDVTFSSKPATLLIGGESDVKQGIAITSGTDGNLIVKIGNEMYTLTPDVAGATLVGKSINLQLSYQKINDGLNFGVWINGKLYDNKYFYVSDNVANYLTGRLAVYPESEGASLKLVSEKTEVLDPLLEKFTFADYGISNGTYTGEDNMEVGYSMGGYDGRVFSGDVLFTKSRADIWIGGQDDPWYGIGILSGYTGDETTLCLKADGREYLMTPEVAGTELVGKTVNLKLSYQLVDTDNDGKKDVLKLGVWFNNKLYNNQYFYIKNHEKYMGPYIGLYTALEDSSITVVSDLAVDNPAMGSRRAPSPNTGDGSDAVLYIGLVVVAVVAIIVVSKKQHLE